MRTRQRVECVALLLLALAPAGCDDGRSLRITGVVSLSSEQGCEAGFGDRPVEPRNQPVSSGLWDFALAEEYVACFALDNLLGGGSGDAIEIESYAVGYGWGEDLGFDLGPGSVPWEIGVTRHYSDVLGVSVPAGHRWVECVPIVPREIAEFVAAAMYWDIPLDPDPCCGRPFAPSILTRTVFRGRTWDGRPVESNTFRFRINAEQGWLVSVPDASQCCDAPPEPPCLVGQEEPVDCRLVKRQYDRLHGYDQEYAASDCCPYAEYDCR